MDDGRGRRLGRVLEVGPASLWLETSAPPPLDAVLTVDLVLGDGAQLATRGRVRRRQGRGCGIRFDPEPATEGFRRRFAARALAADGPRPEVRIAPSAAPDLDAVPPSLKRAWSEAQARLHDDEVQQRFIASCLEAGRIDFAFERYRAARASSASPQGERYVQQVGLLVGFAHLGASDARRLRARARRTRALFAVATAVSIGVGVARWSAARQTPKERLPRPGLSMAAPR